MIRKMIRKMLRRMRPQWTTLTVKTVYLDRPTEIVERVLDLRDPKDFETAVSLLGQTEADLLRQESYK